MVYTNHSCLLFSCYKNRTRSGYLGSKPMHKGKAVGTITGLAGWLLAGCKPLSHFIKIMNYSICLIT